MGLDVLPEQGRERSPVGECPYLAPVVVCGRSWSSTGVQVDQHGVHFAGSGSQGLAVPDHGTAFDVPVDQDAWPP